VPGRALRLAALVPLLSLSACAFHGIDLVQDRRLALTGLKEGATVQVPFTLTWDVKKAIAPGHEVSFAVFVDRAPIKPGQTLRSVVPARDTGCRNDPACPDPTYLARHDVYVVSDPSITVPRMRRAGKKREAHRVTVVILVDGRRDGEGAFSRTVYLPADAS
jgi:hypothetical protein